MKNNRKLLAIHLNEFNYEYLKFGAKKYDFKYLKKFIQLKKISTYTKDKIQNKNLDPWVQSVSIISGKISKNHKVFNLGQQLPKNLINIWDVLTKNKINCWIWGPMNSNYKKNNFLKLFFPDPWNYRVLPYPRDLEYLYFLPRYYAKNYLDLKKSNIIKFTLYFIYGLLKNNILFFLFKNFIFLFKVLCLRGIKNFILFFLFDLLSLHIFSHKLKLNDKQFSFIFLNSLAHYQHNNWNEEKNEKIYFNFVDKILKYIFDLYQKHNSLIIFNGFKQNKIKSEYILRPINPNKFLKKIIKFKKLEQDMTNGGFIFFDKPSDTDKAFKELSKYTVCGYNIFKINQKKSKSLFYRINIKALKDLKLFDINYLTKKKNDEILQI